VVVVGRRFGGVGRVLLTRRKASTMLFVGRYIGEVLGPASIGEMIIGDIRNETRSSRS
jgi:hypothetical protein